ncbi:FtsX-like permease family protein [uncultured Bacteroides sp.]|uniref:ABC transporter permease n=1 Tax=uncultured Bacteroides sp. TaxID=162156 RepID=UPI002AA60C18|nr:FtsX-like permease family protein [uncultured Bacteroides sp.]
MLKHLIHLVWNQRKHNTWLWAELMLVILCLWYVALSLYNNYCSYTAPLGFDISHTYRLDVAPRDSDAEGYIPFDASNPGTGYNLMELVERLRHLEGVEGVSLSITSHPYNAMSNYAQAYVDTTATHLLWYRVTDSFFDVFRIQAADGSSLRGKLTDSSVILTQDAAEKMFPASSNAAGKSLDLFQLGEHATVAAVSTPVSYAEFYGCTPSVYTLLTDKTIETGINSDNLDMVEICIRMRAEADSPDLPEKFLTTYSSRLGVGNLYLKDVRPVEYLRSDLISSGVNRMRLDILLAGFLLVSVFLGVTGTFLFRTRQRQPELALRLALGASRQRLLILLVGEGGVLFILALLPAMLIAWNLFYATGGMISSGTSFGLSMEETGAFVRFGRFLVAMAISSVLTILMMLIGILFPAVRAMGIHPAEALHEE